jgi:hypothetical protein
MDTLIALTQWNSTQKKSNAHWISKVPSPGVIINNGDSIAVKSVFINTSNSPSGNINIRTDTSINMEYCFYYMNSNFNNPYLDLTDYPDASGTPFIGDVSGNFDCSGTFNRHRMQTLVWSSMEYLTPDGINWPMIQQQMPDSVVNPDYYNRTWIWSSFWSWFSAAYPPPDGFPSVYYPVDVSGDIINQQWTRMKPALKAYNQEVNGQQSHSEITPYLVYVDEIGNADQNRNPLTYVYPDTINRVICPCSYTQTPANRSKDQNVPFFCNVNQRPKIYTKSLSFIIKAGSYSRDYIAEYITLQFQTQPMQNDYISYSNVYYNIDNWTRGVNLNRNPFSLQIDLMDWSYMPPDLITVEPFFNYGPFQPIIFDCDSDGNHLFNNLNYLPPNYDPSSQSLFRIPYLLPLVPKKYTDTTGIYRTYDVCLQTCTILPIIQYDNNFFEGGNNVKNVLNPPVVYVNQNQFTYQVPLIGASQIAFLYNENNNNAFSFTMHTPLIVNGVPVVCYAQNIPYSITPPYDIGSGPGGGIGSFIGNKSTIDKHSGIIWTKLEPVSFWQNLGFVVEDIILPPETYAPNPDYTQDIRYRGIIDYEKFLSLSTGQIMGASDIANDDQIYGSVIQTCFNDGAIVLQAAQNTPPQKPISLPKLQIYMNPTNNTMFNNQFWNWINVIIYSSNTVRPMTAQNPIVAPEDAPGHYYIELTGYSNNFMIEDHTLQVKTIVSSYFQSLSSFTTSPYLDPFLYVHNSENPLVLSNIGVRIINPITEATESDVIVGPNSSVYLQITQNRNRTILKKGEEPDPHELYQEIQLQ